MRSSLEAVDQSNPNSQLSAYIALVVVILCWAANTVFARLAVGEISPMLLVSLRWALVVMLLAALARKNLRKDWRLIRKNLWLFFALGALGFTAFNALYYVAAHTTTALNLGIVQGTMPALVLLGSLLFYHTKIRAVQAVGVALTLCGVLVVASEGSVDNLQQFAFKQGDVLVFLACLLYAGYTLWLRKRPDVDALSQLSVMALAAFITSLPLVAIEAATGHLVSPTIRGWVLVTLIALLPSLLSQLLFIRAVQSIGPERATAFVNLVPVVAAVLAVYILGEEFALYHAVALLIVLAGIWMSERSTSP